MNPDRYADLRALADLFDGASEELAERAKLGERVLTDDDVAPSAELSPATWQVVEQDVRAATSGPAGLSARSAALDTDGLVLRATVLTYQWIDALQDTAHRTIGSVAARAVGYLAPQVALGGPIVSVGLIETEAPDRDNLASYLNELAEATPELMAHVVSGGGGLVESLELRALLTTPALGGDDRLTVARGGLRAVGAADFADDFSAALRDVAGSFVSDTTPADALPTIDPRTAAQRPASVEEIIARLTSLEVPVLVQPLPAGRFLAFLTGGSQGGGSLRLVDGDVADRVTMARSAIEAAVGQSTGARVLLAGLGQGGVVAAALAATTDSTRFTIDQVITAGAPSAQATTVPVTIPVLALEDRSDPVALLGSLMNAAISNRLTVVFDGGGARGDEIHLAGGRAADAAPHPELRAAVRRLRDLGYLAPA